MGLRRALTLPTGIPAPACDQVINNPRDWLNIFVSGAKIPALGPALPSLVSRSASIKYRLRALAHAAKVGSHRDYV